MLIIIIALLILIPFFTGFFSFFKSIENFDVCKISNFCLRLFCLNKINFFWFFILNALFFLILLVCISFFSTIKFLKLLIFFIITYFSYSIGFDICILYKTLLSTNFFICVLCYLLWQLLILFLIYIFSLKTMYELKQISCYGNSFFKGQGIKLFLSVYCTILIILIIQTILLYSFKYFFI